MRILALAQRLTPLLTGFILLTAALTAASAATVTVTPATETSAAVLETTDLKAASIGGIRLPSGSVVIKGNQVEVYAVPEWLFDHHLVLRGVSLETNIETQANQTNVSGVVLFTSGDWLTNLGPKLNPDSFTLKGGRIVRGNILATTSDTIQIQSVAGQRENIRIADIAAVSSVRAFHYSIKPTAMKLDAASNRLAGDAAAITFAPTRLTGHAMTAKVPKSNLPGTEGAISNAKLATFITLDLVHDLAPAVMAPIIYSSPNARAKFLLRQAAIQSSAESAAPAASTVPAGGM